MSSRNRSRNGVPYVPTTHNGTTTSILPEGGHEPSTQDPAEPARAGLGQMIAAGMVFPGLGSTAQCPSGRPLIVEGKDDERIIFKDIDEDPWKYFISHLDHISDDDDDEASGILSVEDEDNQYWVEFEHEGESPWGSFEEHKDDNMSDDDSTIIISPESEFSSGPSLRSSNQDFDSTSTTLSETDFDLDLPLSRFQPLPVSPYAPSCPAPKHHPHPYPKISSDPLLGRITIEFPDEAHDRCYGFQLAMYVAQLANMPLPLSRRVHELQGVIAEDRVRHSRRRRYGREGRSGSSLWQEW